MPVFSERIGLNLVGLIYEAAGDPGLWSELLTELSTLLKAPTFNFAVQEFPPSRGRYNFELGSVGLDPCYFRSYKAYYGAKNPVLTQGGRLMEEGHVYRNAELCPDEEFVRTEFYNDWITPQRMSHALFGIVLKGKGYTAFTNVVRYLGAPPFSEDEIDLLRVLNPHLKQAVELHLRIRNLESREEAATEALDRWNLGVILLDCNGTLVFMNRSAEAILKRQDGLQFHGNGLRAGTLSETSILQKLITGATGITCQPTLTLHPGGALALSRPSGKRPLEILITPACQNRMLVPERNVSAIVFVNDPDEAEESDTVLLRHLYGLSRAEADVAALLLQGKEIKEVTDKLHISRNTAKTHLSRLFEKTGTRRQAELLRLLLRGPASLRAQYMTVVPALKKQAS